MDEVTNVSPILNNTGRSISKNSSASSNCLSTIISELPQFITSKIASMLAAVFLLDLNDFIRVTLEQFIQSGSGQVAQNTNKFYSYYIIQSFAEQLSNPSIKLPTSKLAYLKTQFSAIVNERLFDQILLEITKLRNVRPSQTSATVIASPKLSSDKYSFQADVYIKTLHAIVTVCPADVCFKPGLLGFVEFILDTNKTPTKCIISSLQLLQELLMKQDVSSSQFAVLEIIGNLLAQSLTNQSMIVDEGILNSLIELTSVFVKDHCLKIVETSGSLIFQVLKALQTVTFNLVCDNEESTDDIIDWNDIFIKCLEIWKSFFENVSHLSVAEAERGQQSNIGMVGMSGMGNGMTPMGMSISGQKRTTSNYFQAIYPDVMEVFVQALQCRGSSKVAGIDREKTSTLDIQIDEVTDEEDVEREERNMTEWDEFFQAIAFCMVELGTINEGKIVVFNRMSGLLQEISGSLQEEVKNLELNFGSQNGQANNNNSNLSNISNLTNNSTNNGSSLNFDISNSDDITDGIEPVLNDTASIIFIFEQIISFAPDDESLQKLFEIVLEIGKWARSTSNVLVSQQSNQNCFKPFETQINEILRSSICVLNVILPWVHARDKRYLSEILEFSLDNPEKSKSETWSLRMAKSKLYQTCLKVPDSPAEIPSKIQIQSRESTTIELLSLAGWFFQQNWFFGFF